MSRVLVLTMITLAACDGRARHPVPTNPSTPRLRLVGAGVQKPREVAADATHVYFTTWGDETQARGLVLRAPIAGGPSETLAREEGSTHAIVADGERVYFTVWAAGVRAVRKNGGEASWLLQDPGVTGGLALDGDALLAASTRGIVRIPKEGGAPTVVEDRDGPSAIALDAQRIYWVSRGTAGSTRGFVRTIDRADWPNGERVRQLAVGFQLGSAYGHSLALDATHLYVASSGVGRIFKIPKQGGPWITLPTALARPQALLFAGESLYASQERSLVEVARSGSGIATIVDAEGLGLHGFTAAGDELVFAAAGGVYAVPR